VNADIPADQYEIARQNTEESKRRILERALPRDGGEATNYNLKKVAGTAILCRTGTPTEYL
jgi:hypothetical protein